MPKTFKNEMVSVNPLPYSTHIHTHRHTHTYIHTQTHIHTQTYTHTHTYIHTHTPTHTHTHTNQNSEVGYWLGYFLEGSWVTLPTRAVVLILLSRPPRPSLVMSMQQPPLNTYRAWFPCVKGPGPDADHSHPYISPCVRMCIATHLLPSWPVQGRHSFSFFLVFGIHFLCGCSGLGRLIWFGLQKKNIICDSRVHNW